MAEFTELLGSGILGAGVDQLEFPTPDEMRRLYERARRVARRIGADVNAEDIVEMRPAFWYWSRHPIFVLDTAMGTTLTIHFNLCVGTIGMYASGRPDLTPLIEKLLNFDLCGEYLLTEIGHGLDARNLETTATLQPDGSFDLHTPNMAAAKVMPPTSPLAGVGKVGVVFARLIVSGADHGVKPFIVYLSNDEELLPGITCRLLPKRCGSKALDHAITTFNHVRLGPESLLGTPARPEDEREDFFRQIHRVTAGTLSLSMGNISALKLSSLITATYSFRRRIASASGKKNIPIIQFPTQYRPILDAIVQSWAYDAFADKAIELFLDTKIPMEARHGVAVCFKATVGPDTQTSIHELTERCGWQGLFAYNRMIELALALRGNAVAEGDYTVLCIRLVAEVLLGRYELPEAKMPTCALAKHEAGIWQETRETIMSLGDGHHRSEGISTHLLPRCRDLVKATGHRMAYEAAAAGGKLKREALELFESTCIKADLSWYCQFDGLNRNDFFTRDTRLAKAALPLLQEFISQSEFTAIAAAPIMDETSWNEFVASLPKLQGSRPAEVWHDAKASL